MNRKKLSAVLTAALLAGVLRRGAPEFSLVLVLCAGAWMLLTAADSLGAAVALMEELSALAGLDEALLERSPFELSGGQKRRVAVAGVMAMKPRILVLDEPAAGLDPEGRDEILSEVKNYHKKTGTTVLLVSHSMEDIAKYADRVLVMSNKKIAMYDTVEQVFARAPELLALGLSVPQVTKIFLKLREMGVDVPADVYTVPYAVKMILEAKQRRDAGESLVLPREQSRKGGVSEC